MSGYSKRRLAGHCARKPAAPKKVHGLEKEGSHGEKKCDNQRCPQAQTCDIKNIQISAVYSLSQLGSNNNSSVESRFDEDHHDPVVVRPAEVEYISLDDDTLSISSNESDCDITEGASNISENVSTTKYNSKDKSHTKFISIDLTEDDGAKHDPEENKGHEEPSQVFCCTPYWLAYIYKKPFQCTCAEQTAKLGGGDVVGSSSPVGQSVIELESCEGKACLVEDRTNTVQKGSTSTAELRLTQKKRQESNDNSEEHIWNQKRQREGCRVEGTKSEREISLLMGKQDSSLNTVLELKTSRTGNKDGANNHKNVHPSDSHLYEGKEEAKTVTIDSDIVFIPLNKSDSDIMEAEVSIQEHVRKDLPRQNICQQATPASPMSELGNYTCCNNANISKADQNKKIPTYTGYIHGKSTSGTCSDVLHEHSLASCTVEIPEQSLVSLDINTEQHSQSLPKVDQEYWPSWTDDQLSELVTQFPFGMNNMYIDKSSKGKETAGINQNNCCEEVIDSYLDSLEGLTNQFDEDYTSLPSIDRRNNVLPSAVPSDQLSKDKTAEKIKSTFGKKFCCILSWSAYIYGEQSKCNCTFVPSTTNKPILKNIQPDKLRLESSCETTEILASPKLDANKSNIGKGKGKKVRFKFLDNTQLELQKEEQSPQTQLCKNLVVKDRSRTGASTPIRDSEIDLGSMTESSGLFKYGSSSFKKSSIPGHKSTGICPAKSICSLEEISEQSFSSEEAFERSSPTMADKKDALMHNLGVFIQENELMKSCQNTQTSTKKSVIIDTKENFPDLENNTSSRLRKLEGKQKPSKRDCTLVNKVNENTNEMDFRLLPAVQNLTKKAQQGIDSEVKQEKPKKRGRKKKPCIPTEGKQTSSTSSKKGHSLGLDQNIFPLDTTEAPPSSLCKLKSSNIWDNKKVRSEKAKNSLSEKGSSKRRKSELSNKNTSSAKKRPSRTKESGLDLGQTAGRLGGAEVSSKGDVSAVKKVIEASLSDPVTKCPDQPPNEEIWKVSDPENEHNSNDDMKNPNQKQKIEADNFRSEMTTSSCRNQSPHGLHVPSCGEIKATVSSPMPILKESTKKMDIEQDTKFMDGARCHLDKASLPASHTEGKTVDATCCVRSIEQSTPKEKMCVRQCFVKLYRLPLALETQFLLGNVRETDRKSNEREKADTEMKEK